MTMSELAKLANVSVSTVSKAFCGAKDINPETKEKILNLAKEYGCYGKYFKGKYNKNVIAIICPEIIGGYYGELVNILTAKIEKENGLVIVANDSFDEKKQAELIEYFCSYLKVDGIIITSLKCKLKKSYDTPIVVISNNSDNDVDSVNIVLDSAMEKAIKTLKKLGHNNIAFFGENLTLSKAEIFKKAAKNEFLNDNNIFTSNYRFHKAGEDCVEKMLSQKSECTAAICAYDDIAYGAIKALSKIGIKVPYDFSVIGFDNSKVTGYTETSLSSIDMNSEKVCEKTCETLIRKIKNRYYRNGGEIDIVGDLIIRESIAPNNHNKI